MMRTTGYSLSITGMMQVRGKSRRRGVHARRVRTGGIYIEELRKRGVDIKES